MQNSKFVPILFFLECIFYASAQQLRSADSLARNKRTLIFPPTTPTRVQFIGGIGIPVEDLQFESVTSGYVLKSENFLPTLAEEWRIPIRPQTIHRRSMPHAMWPNYNNTTTHTHHHYQAQNSSTVHMQHAAVHADAAARIAYTNKPSTSFGNNLKSQQTNASIYRWIIYKGIETILNSTGQPGHVCLLRSICEHAALPLHYESGLLAEILHIILTPSTSHDADLAHGGHSAYLQAEQLGRDNGIMCAHNYGACLQSPIDQITAVFDIS